MTPDQISALTAIAAIVSKVGTWPIGSVIFAIVFGPWIGMFLLSRAMEKRHEAALKMYEDNVKLVENYEKVAEGLQSIIVLATQTMTQVKDSVVSNQYCPAMRKGPKGPRGPQ